MANRLMIAGIIVLVLGIAMIGGGVASLRGTTATFRTFTEPVPGEYVSTEIILNSSSAVVVRSPASAGGLIPAQDLSVISSLDIGSYAVIPTSTAAGSDTYVSLATGDYYYVAFSSSEPSSDVVIAGNLRHTIISGGLVLLGFLFVIIGAVLSLVGWRRGRRSGNKVDKEAVSDSEYYAKRGGDPQQPPSAPSSS